jgi:citrate synthase
MHAPTASGLDDVVAAETVLSDVNGQLGQLVIRGHAVEELVETSTFEDIAALMWNGETPGAPDRESLRASLAAARQDAFRMLPSLGGALDGPDAMEALRAGVAHLRATADQREDRLRLTAAIPVFSAAWHRAAVGQPAVAPRPALSHAADYLQMLSGTLPDAARVAGLDAYLCCVADHGMNASTFAARVVASTGSDMVSAIVAAIGALKGPLHGGANADVMRLLLEVGKEAPPAKIDEVIRGKLARKEKIPGFGHRVYHTEDPRATHLRQMSRDLGQRAGATEWFEMSQRIEALVKAEKKLNPNVDFYSASTYYALGIPIDLFTPIFAVSRISGWTAHVLEQYRHNRLIRPRTDYIGPPYPQKFTPLKDR